MPPPSPRERGTAAGTPSNGVTAPAVSVRRPWRAAAFLPTLVSVTALVGVVSSLGAPLVPTMARAEGVSVSTAQWLLTAPLVVGAAATPVLGRLADGRGQRRVVLAALGIVVAGCGLAAAASSFPVVVVGRGMQGVGLGLASVTMAIARRHLPTVRTGPAIAALSVASSIGVGLGYPLTGVVAQALDYRAAFWFGAALSAGALVLAAFVVPTGGSADRRRFDLVGALAAALATVGVCTVLSQGDAWGWRSPETVGVAAASCLVAAAWIGHELRIADPLVDLRQVRKRLVLTADVACFLVSVGTYLFIPVVVEFVQAPAALGYGFGTSIVVSGLVLLPMSLLTLAASRVVPRVDRRFGARSVVPFGAVIFGAGSAFFALAHGALWEAFVAAALAGVGYGFTYAAMPGFIVRAVPPRETGSATGFYGVVRSVGLSLGSALGAALLAASTRHGHRFPSAGGYRAALLVAAAVCAVTAVVSFGMAGPEMGRGRPGVARRAVPSPPLEPPLTS